MLVLSLTTYVAIMTPLVFFLRSYKCQYHDPHVVHYYSLFYSVCVRLVRQAYLYTCLVSFKNIS